MQIIFSPLLEYRERMSIVATELQKRVWTKKEIKTFTFWDHNSSMKRSPWFDFANVLWAPFTHEDPKIAKNTDDLNVFFVLLGSVCVKLSV